MDEETGLTKSMSPLDTTRISLQLIGAILSTYGVFWIFVQSYRKLILKNTAGFLIVAIAVADLFAAMQYAYTALDYIFMFWKYLESEVAYKLGIWMYHVFNWSLLSAAQWELTLALHTLYILKGGVVHSPIFKWLMILAGAVGPVLYFFLPAAIHAREPLFEAWTSDDGVNYFLLGAISGLVLTGLATFFLIWRNLKAYTISYGKSTRMPSAAANLVLRLVMVYSLSMIVAFGPFWIKTLIFTVATTTSELDYIYEHPVSIVSLVLLLKDLTSPFRGYIHAVAVHYVYLTTNSNECSMCPKTVLRCLLLIETSETSAPKDPPEKVNFETRDANPMWSFTFQSNLVHSSGSRSYSEREDSYLDIRSD